MKHNASESYRKQGLVILSLAAYLLILPVFAHAGLCDYVYNGVIFGQGDAVLWQSTVDPALTLRESDHLTLSFTTTDENINNPSQGAWAMGTWSIPKPSEITFSIGSHSWTGAPADFHAYVGTDGKPGAWVIQLDLLPLSTYYPDSFMFFTDAELGRVRNIVNRYIYGTGDVPGGMFLFGSEALGTDNTQYWQVTPHNSTVPIPAAAWIFGSGLLGLIGVRKRMRG